MSTNTMLPVPPSADSVTLQRFIDDLKQANPFFTDRVDRPLAAAGGQVDSIHDREFRKVLALAQQVHEQHRGVGVVVWGEAGSGKSHLLSRLAVWATPPGRACLVSLPNLLCSPEDLPRCILRSVMNVLTGGQRSRLHQTPLFVLVNGGVRQALRQQGIECSVSWEAAAAAYRSWVEGLMAQDPWSAVLIDPVIFDVLYRFYESAYRAWKGKDESQARDALRWLSGDTIDADAAAALGLEDDRADSEQIRKILVALAHHARSRRLPLVLTFDQVDNLDADQLRCYARFLHDLLDSTGNLLVVTAGLQTTLSAAVQDGWIHKPAWDRIGQYKLTLGRISRDDARHILEARLEKYFEPYLQVAEIKQRLQGDSLFPLGRQWFDQRIRDLVEVRPRDVINWARDRWESQQEAAGRMTPRTWIDQWMVQPGLDSRRSLTEEEMNAAIDGVIEQKLADLVAERRAQPHLLLPADGDRLLPLVHSLLGECRPRDYPVAQVWRPAAGRSSSAPTYHLMIQQPAGADGRQLGIGITFVVTDSGNSATAFLRRLANDNQPPDRVILVTDARLPLSKAGKGGDYFNDLFRRGPDRFRHIELSVEDYAYLDGLYAVVLLARSGDLELEAVPGQRRQLSADDVFQSHHRRQRFRASRLLGQLFVEG